ncbi:MAG: nitroreductase family protein [Oscillospiraceae bacterium]|nr:nitroreductase family protein [Oscillospiraceae bacterium]
MLENLKERRSIRKYKLEQVSDAHLDAILEAGLYAASGMNTQNTVMVAVRDKATRDQLSRMNAEVMGTTADPFYGAPCVVVVLVEPERYTAVEDGSLVMGNLMQAAYDIGLGSCWIHRARQMFESEEGKALLHKWGLREDLIGVANCVLGYPDEVPAPKPRREGRVIKV